MDPGPHGLGFPAKRTGGNGKNLSETTKSATRTGLRTSSESRKRDSNPRPTHYECVALPTEPFRQQDFGNRVQKYGSFPKQQSIFPFFCTYGILFPCFSQVEKNEFPKAHCRKTREEGTAIGGRKCREKRFVRGIFRTILRPLAELCGPFVSPFRKIWKKSSEGISDGKMIGHSVAEMFEVVESSTLCGIGRMESDADIEA